jgi:hypothetical protein
VADAPWPRGSQPEDGWGPARSVRSRAADAAGSRPDAAAGRFAGGANPANPAVDGNAAWSSQAPAPNGASPWDRLNDARPAVREPGVAGPVALVILVGATALGILIDAMRGQQLGSGFNIGIIAGSVLGIIIVRRSGMFPVVVAPPIVYSLGAGISLYVRSSGLHDRGVLIDAATNWLVYGFPAIALATAAVLIIAGIRLIARR